MNAGSFFRLHRDAYRDNPQMRIFIPLNKTDLHEWAFMYNDAMVDDIYHILMSVHITEENFKTVTKMLPNCKEH